MPTIVVLVVSLALIPWTAAGPEAPDGLMCQLLSRPDLAACTERTPVFGWIVRAAERGTVQSAYHVRVGSARELILQGKGDLWDSGRVRSSQSANVEYAGKPLAANSTYRWAVRVWDGRGRPSPFSAPQAFHTGDFDAQRSWPGESRWVKITEGAGERWAFEDRHPISYREIAPARIVEKSAGHYFADFGRAAFGTLVVEVSSPSEGQELQVLLGEKLAGEGSVDPAPGGSIGFFRTTLAVRKGQHRYTLQLPRHRPRYPHTQVLPEHMPEVQPFRYAEILNCPSPLRAADVRQLALFYQFDANASSFKSSSTDLNAVWDLCKYTLEATPFLGLYVDGNRERMPYEADAFIQQLGHYSVDREYAVARYTTLNLLYHATWPTEWILHSVLMAWADYMYTGNTDVLIRHYDTLKAKTLLALAREDGLISTRTGLMTPEVLKSVHFKDKALIDIVDWPHGTPPGQLNRAPEGFGPGGETDNYVFTTFNTVVNAFHYRALVLMSRIAGVTGHAQDAADFQGRAEKQKESFNRVFFDAARGIYVDGDGTDHASLHANMFPMAFGLVPDERRASVAAFVKGRGMACSVYGAQHLLDALYNAGEAQAALDLMTAKTDRSWWNTIRAGSTMAWEAWDIKYKPNLTWNHAWGTAPANIVPRRLMGIEPLEAGFAKARIYPQPANLQSASVVTPTIRGTIRLGFDRRTATRTLWSLRIPANMVVEFHLPAAEPSGVLESGSPAAEAVGVKLLRSGNGRCVFEVGSGEYVFDVNPRGER